MSKLAGGTEAAGNLAASRALEGEAGARLTVVQYLSTHTAMGGLEYHVLTLCENLDRERINIVLACRADSHPELFEWAARLRIPVHTFPPAKTEKVEFLKRAVWLARLLRSQSADVLHIHAVGFSGLPAYMAAWLARIRSTLVTHHAWFSTPSSWFQRVSLWFEKRFTNHVIGFNREMTKDMVSLGIPASNISIVPHGVDLRRFTFSKGRPAEEPSIFTLIMVARMIEGKGHEEIIRAVHMLKDKYPQLRLLLVGDGVNRSEVEAVVEELGIYSIVEMTGYLPNSEVPAQMARADAIALPTYCEGETFGIVLIEGMAMGLPTIGTRFAAIPDIIDDGETGFVVEPRDVQGLAQAIEQMVSDKKRAEEMGRKARLRAETLFSAEALGRSMTRLYLETTPPRGRNEVSMQAAVVPMPSEPSGNKRI